MRPDLLATARLLPRQWNNATQRTCIEKGGRGGVAWGVPCVALHAWKTADRARGQARELALMRASFWIFCT